MTIKAIIEMMDKLGFSNTAKHRVSYDLLESSMYIPVEAFPDNIRCVQYKEIVDYNSETYILE